MYRMCTNVSVNRAYVSTLQDDVISQWQVVDEFTHTHRVTQTPQHAPMDTL